MDPAVENFNLEVKCLYVFRFITSYFIQPKYFAGFSRALDEYCKKSFVNCLSFAAALDCILKGEGNRVFQNEFLRDDNFASCFTLFDWLKPFL